jgi:hypothetical protein
LFSKDVKALNRTTLTRGLPPQQGGHRYLSTASKDGRITEKENKTTPELLDAASETTKARGYEPGPTFREELGRSQAEELFAEKVGKPGIWNQILVSFFKDFHLIRRRD